MSFRRICRFLILVSAISLVLILVAGASLAKSSFPNKPIEIVCPYKAGGATDSYLRVLAPNLEKILGVRVMINNIAGGEGVPAVDYLAKAPADGYTIYAMGPEEVLNALYGRIDMKVFAGIARCQQDQGMLWVRTESPYKTVQDVIDYAKANPGKMVWTGSYGIDQVILGQFFEATGITVRYVPYDVGREATAFLLGGHAEVEFEEPGAMLAQIEAKTARPLVVFSSKRLPKFPDVPTASELGFKITTARWRGITTRAGVPRENIAILQNAVRKAMDAPEYRRYEEQNILDQSPGWLEARDFDKFLDETYEQYKKILLKLGVIK